MLAIVGFFFLAVVWFVGSYWIADIHYAKGDNLAALQDYGDSLSELYKAYNLRKEPIYADKISNVLAQVTVIESSQGQQSIQCPSHEHMLVPCPELVEKYSKEAITSSPQNVYFYRTLARDYILLYQATRDEKYYERALDAVKKARQLAPTDAHYPYTQALFYLAKYENTKKPSADDAHTLENAGLGAANFALKLKSDYRDAYYAKGLILKQLGKKDEAKEVFDEYLKHYNSGDPQILNELKTL